MASRWVEVPPSGHLRDRARRLLRTHGLRAADGLQLAAALTVAIRGSGPAGLHLPRLATCRRPRPARASESGPHDAGTARATPRRHARARALRLGPGALRRLLARGLRAPARFQPAAARRGRARRAARSCRAGRPQRADRRDARRRDRQRDRESRRAAHAAARAGGQRAAARARGAARRGARGPRAVPGVRRRRPRGPADRRDGRALHRRREHRHRRQRPRPRHGDGGARAVRRGAPAHATSSRTSTARSSRTSRRCWIRRARSS